MRILTEYEKRHSLYEMAQIGKLVLSGIGECRITIYSEPGSIPHFHVISGNPQHPEWETCIELLSSSYFHHGGKRGELNTKQRKELIKFLNTKNIELSLSNWQATVVLWNLNNENNKVNRNSTMPDYMYLQ